MTASKKKKQFSAVSIPMPVNIATASGGKKMLTIMIMMRYGMLRIVAMMVVLCAGVIGCRTTRVQRVVLSPGVVTLSFLEFLMSSSPSPPFSRVFWHRRSIHANSFFGVSGGCSLCSHWVV